MKNYKAILLALVLAPASAFATIIGDGFTQGNGHVTTPYLVDLTEVTQTIVAGINEPVTDYWKLEVLTEGTYGLSFASATIVALNVAIDGFSVSKDSMTSASGIYTLDLQPGSYDFFVSGTAKDGFSHDIGPIALGIGGIYTVTTDFVEGDVNGDGDVSKVPVPAAVWFMGTAMLGLLTIGRRKKA